MQNKIILTIILLSALLYPPKFTSASQANYPLEIIQPREGLDTKNRFYKAYPGLVYNVRLAVIGGVYPFHHELTTAPSGMTINSFTGEINWDNPTESEMPHTVVAKVTDSQGTIRTVKWPITVTTSGFRFLDAVNGTLASQGGDGSIDNPWKAIVDFYTTSKHDKSYAGEFLYFKNGTYSAEGIGDALESGPRMAMIANAKPNVWLAYPGENPVIDVEYAHIALYGITTNLYFDGLEFQSNTNNGQVRFTGSANDVVIRKCLFDMNNSPGTGSNTSHLMSTNWNSGGQYWSIQDNIGKNISTDAGGYWFLGYHGHKVLVENNFVKNTGNHGISTKHQGTMWFIRGNYVTGTESAFDVQHYGDISGNIEISYNYGSHPSGVVSRIGPHPNCGPIYVFRNTLLGRIDVRGDDYVNETNGPFYFNNNIIINNDSGNKIYYKGSFPERIIANDNLLGVESDNIVDEDGDITSLYSQYLGTHGWQFSDESTPMDKESGPPISTLPADLNSDGIVNIFDYNIFLQNFGATDCDNIADLNNDCNVNIFDYNIFLENFGRSA